MPTFAAEQLRNLAQQLIAAIGASPADASIVAEHLVEANLAGHDSHGMIRIPQYAAHAREGKLAVDRTWELEHATATTALVNGNWTWGQVVATAAVDQAITKARAHGLAAVAARQCYHVGRVGVYPLRAAAQGLIAKVWCNGTGVVRVAPWGGAEPRLATNPIAIAIPTGGAPILVDITTSVVAEGKIRVARNAGKPVPEGWLLDKLGQPTTNPADLYDGGTLLPFGGPVGHKGYSLSLVVDVLGGILSGAGCGVMPGVAVGNGLFIEVCDPAAFEPIADFRRRVDDYVAYLKSARPRPGTAEILLPGEPELRTAAERRRTGIAIDAETWRQIETVAEQLGVDLGAAAQQ